MSEKPTPERQRLLIVVELPEPEPVPWPLLEAFTRLEVTLLGFYDLPEQTSPEQARDQFQEEAREELDDLAGQAEDFGAEVGTRLAFSSNLAKTIEEVVEQDECDAVLAAKPADTVERILVPLYGERQQPVAVSDFVCEMVCEPDTEIMLLQFAEEEGAKQKQETLNLYRDRFMDAGLSEEQVKAEVLPEADVVDEVVSRAEGFDLVVLGQEKPSVRSSIMGEVHEAIIKKCPSPVIVVYWKPEKEGAR
jgi:nucleotide-binding universal stress UspA family protein